MKIAENIRFTQFGDNGLLINIADKDLMAANRSVIRLTRILRHHQNESILEIIPASESITVIYDLFRITYNELFNKIVDLIDVSKESAGGSVQTLKIPICYDIKYAPDMNEVCSQTGLSAREVIDAHIGTTYIVMMSGFMPGFFYFGLTQEKLQVGRKATPRLRVPEGAVGLADRQTGIYSSQSPGGWQIIGKSLNLLNEITRRNLQLNLGDQVKFYEVSEKELFNLSKA